MTPRNGGGGQIGAVLFDCDGVLVDSERVAVECIVEFAACHGAEFEFGEALDRFTGARMADTVHEIEKRAGCTLPGDFEDRLRARMAAEFKTRLKPMDGAAALVKALDVPYCVVSNGPRAKMEVTLRVTGLLEYFAGRIVSAYEVGAWKPDPAIFLHAARLLGAAPRALRGGGGQRLRHRRRGGGRHAGLRAGRRRARARPAGGGWCRWRRSQSCTSGSHAERRGAPVRRVDARRPGSQRRMRAAYRTWCRCAHALIGDSLYVTIDEKPKRSDARAMKRLRNIAENPNAAAVVDRYDEDWSRLAWVMLRGRAEILTAAASTTARRRCCGSAIRNTARCGLSRCRSSRYASPG